MTTECEGNIEKLLSVMPALSRLNSWCRVEYKDQLGMESMVSRIYGWKRAAIAAAMRLGIAQLRLVSVPRSCRTCKGTATYIWQDWNDEDHVEYETCRRCQGTGKVILRFVESTIGETKWHTPRPKWDLGLFDEDACEKIAVATDWEPGQPGAVLDRLEFIRLINQVETVIYEGRTPPQPGSYDGWGIHLGMQAGCWICGSINCRTDYKIWRPIGLRWDSAVCDDCWRTEAWSSIAPTWPMTLHPLRERDSYPAWHDRVPLPPLARDPAVVEWLARRQIFPGAYPAGDHAYTCNGYFGRVLSADPHGVVFQVDEHWTAGMWQGVELRLRHDMLRPTGRNPFTCDTMEGIVSPALGHHHVATTASGHVTAGIFGSTVGWKS
jgi:hypothetical protein